MFRNKTAAFALAVGSFLSVAVPSAALAHDRDDNRWRDSRQERRLSARELRAAEQRRMAQQRYLREQAQRQRYSAPDSYSARDGYYDRSGRWHSYRSW